MAEYNDGKWHGHDGSKESPVHPATMVEAVWHDPISNMAGVSHVRRAKEEDPLDTTLAWGHVVKFRVIKPYFDPREIWVCFDTEGNARGARNTKEGLSIFGFSDHRLFREVLP